MWSSIGKLVKLVVRYWLQRGNEQFKECKNKTGGLKLDVKIKGLQGNRFVIR